MLLYNHYQSNNGDVLSSVECGDETKWPENILQNITQDVHIFGGFIKMYLSRLCKITWETGGHGHKRAIRA